MFEAGKEYVTRDGRRARVYATDGGGDHPIHGATQIGDEWFPRGWSLSGSYYGDGARSAAEDLIPPRPPVVVSDAVIDAFRSVLWRMSDRTECVRDRLAAAIEQYLAEQEPR